MIVAFVVVVAGILICIYIGVRRNVLRHCVVVVLMCGAVCLRQGRLHRT